jgi:cation diffusion facilitator family transporter
MVLKNSYQIQILVLIVSVVIFIVKVYAYLYTHSQSILTDALESIVNIIAASFALYALYIANKPKDKDHPYGHGKIEFISSMLEGTLIAIAGIGMFVHALFELNQKPTIHELDLGILLLTICSLLNFILGVWMKTQGKKLNSISLISGGKHLQTDTYSTLGLLIGLVAIKIFDMPIIDLFLTIIFGAYIAYVGIKILIVSIRGIMDEIDLPFLIEFTNIINEIRKENWIDIHNVRTIRYGNAYHVDAHITLPWYINVQEGHEEISYLEQELKKRLRMPIELFIHIDPCIPACCKLCLVKECSHRKDSFETKQNWTVDLLLPNSKHFNLLPKKQVV